MAGTHTHTHTHTHTETHIVHMLPSCPNRGHRGCKNITRHSNPPLPLHPPSSSFSNSFSPSPPSPLFFSPVTHAAMQSSLLCRQNCRDSHLPFLFLVISIHLPMSSGAEPASSVLSARCRTQRLLRACTLTLLITCLCVCVCARVHICVCSLPHLHTTLPFFLSFFLCLSLWLCRSLEGYRYAVNTWFFISALLQDY